MTAQDGGAAQTCSVETAPDGGTRVIPCQYLQKMLTAGGRNTAGAHIQTMGRFDSDVMHRRLVIQPLKRQGGGMVANFCPSCGEPLTLFADGFNAFRATRVTGGTP